MKKQTQKNSFHRLVNLTSKEIATGLASILLVGSMISHAYANASQSTPPLITSWKANIISERVGGSLQIYGTNLQPAGKTSFAPESGSYIELRYTNLTTKRFGDNGFFGNQTNLSIYTDKAADLRNIREIAYVTSRGTATLGSVSSAQPDNTPKLESFKVVPINSMVGGSIQLYGYNLNLRPAGTRNLRPESGSSITITYTNRYTKIVDESGFFGDERNLSFYTHNFSELTGISSVAYISPRGTTTTTKNLSPSQPAIVTPLPALSGFRVTSQHSTSRLTLVGQNLSIASNAQRVNEFVRVYFANGKIKNYPFGKYIGSPSNIYIFESGSEAFAQITRVDFVSPSRRVATSTNRLP